MNLSNTNIDPQNIDIDEIKDEKEIQKYSQQLMDFYWNYDFLLRNLSKKFDIRDYKSIPKRKINDMILKKVEESSKDSVKIQEQIKQLLESQFAEGRQGFAAKIENLEQTLARVNQEKQDLSDENQNLRQRVQTLENLVENAKQHLTFSIQDLKLHIENKPQIFSQTELENLTSDLALHQPPAKDIELITFNQLDKKIIVQYRMDQNIANLHPARVEEEQVIPKEFFDQVWTVFANLCTKLAQQNEITLNLVQKLANFIQSGEEANLAKVQQTLQQKQTLLAQLLAAQPEHYVFSEIQKIIEDFERKNVLDCDSINKPAFEIYQRLLDQNQEIVANYEQIILQYIRTE